MLFEVAFFSIRAQELKNLDDEMQRGYYDRPYQRYEAEPEQCTGEFTLLLPSEPYTQQEVQTEASNGIAIQLNGTGDYVEWICTKEADALSLRFSLPDNDEGLGNKGQLDLLVNGNKIVGITLDSYWAWQYNPISNSQTKYPDNLPSQSKFARMRFDEVYMKLPTNIKEGDRFSLRKTQEDNIIYTIDFIELEKAGSPVTFEELEGDKVKYDGDGGTLQAFINANGGKTIYLPEGSYRIPRRIVINENNTKLIGAGMWHTTLYFSASPASRRTASDRGIESYASGVTLEGFTMNSASNMRYFENNESLGAGKGLQGSFGKGSVVRNLRIDHFECGAWIGDYGGPASDGLLVEHCRFRNNYADGINLCSGSVNGNVTHCSFRNNGDDDMASWSTGNFTKNNTFSYCTAENNWRASSLGFFGGENNMAHHIVVSDALEGGVRINADFQGTGFSNNGEIKISDISIYRSGCNSGKTGDNGDHWGNSQPSLLIQPGAWYDINNLRIEDLDIYDTRFQAISIKANNGKQMNGLEMHGIRIHGVNEKEVDFFMASNLSGYGNYSGLEFDTEKEKAISNIPARFNFQQVSAGVSSAKIGKFTIQSMKGGVKIKNFTNNSGIFVFDIKGSLIANQLHASEEYEFFLPQGFYVVKSGDNSLSEKIMVR